MLRPFFATAVALTLTASLHAQGLQPVRLELSANKPPARALKVHFLPHLSEQVPGNAAPEYEKVFPTLMKINRAIPSPQHVAADDWRSLPLKDFPLKEAREHLKNYEGVLADVEKASRHEYCDWGLLERLRKSGIGVLLPEVQEMRNLAALLGLRARAEMAEGNFAAAARTLTVGYTLGRHVGEQPTLIGSLVGNAICQIMNGQLELLVQMPDCPCLYWAITDLPSPLVNMRVPTQGDRLMVAGTFPGLLPSVEDPKGRAMTEEEARKAAEMLPRLFEFRSASDRLPPELQTRRLALRMLDQHDAAKKKLIEQGRPADVVEKMPHIQVALLYGLAEYDQYYDELEKLQSLPYHELAPRMAELDRQIKARRANPPADAPALPLATEFLPSMGRVFLARGRLERRLAAFRTVEAIRLYAAEHKGELPESLADIKSVPVPNDPGTGKPFEYKKDGDRATFRGPRLEGEPVNQNTLLWYEITIRK